MSEKIQRWRVTNGYPTFHSNRDGEWCDATDVSVLESRLAEAELIIADAWAALRSRLDPMEHDSISGAIESLCDDLATESNNAFDRKLALAEAEKERDALSARVRELEGALGPVIEPNVGLIGEPGTVGSVVTLEQFARAARALKGGA